jgi:hypothetical protein
MIGLELIAPYHPIFLSSYPPLYASRSHRSVCAARRHCAFARHSATGSAKPVVRAGRTSRTQHSGRHLDPRCRRIGKLDADHLRSGVGPSARLDSRWQRHRLHVERDGQRRSVSHRDNSGYCWKPEQLTNSPEPEGEASVARDGSIIFTRAVSGPRRSGSVPPRVPNTG